MVPAEEESERPWAPPVCPRVMTSAGVRRPGTVVDAYGGTQQQRRSCGGSWSLLPMGLVPVY